MPLTLVHGARTLAGHSEPDAIEAAAPAAFTLAGKTHAEHVRDLEEIRDMHQDDFAVIEQFYRQSATAGRLALFAYVNRIHVAGYEAGIQDGQIAM